MKNYLIKIRFRSRLRLPSQGRIGLASPAAIGAERLFSFISLGWTILYGEKDLNENVVQPFANANYPWCHSDLFPCVRNELFIPSKNFLPYPETLSDSFTQYWLPLKEVLRHPPLQEMPFSTDLIETSVISRAAKASFGQEPPGKNFVSLANLRSNVEDANPSEYFCSFLNCSDKTIVEKLEKALRFMKDEGFGGLRSSGFGEIEFLSVEELDVESEFSPYLNRQDGSAKKTKHLLLSACCPTEKMLHSIMEMPEGENRYSISRSGGWIYDSCGKHTGVKKAARYYFETGSEFAVKPEGKLIDLSQDAYKCYRYAVPYVVSIER